MTVVMHRILVVSESRITRRVVEMTFADQPVELVTALTGPAGLEVWDARGAAVVLADVAMDGLDGLALARHVQATAGPRPVAVLLMAGQHDVLDAAAVADADVRAVVRKPLDSLQLIDAVREVLRTARPPKPAPEVSAASEPAAAEATPLAPEPAPAAGDALAADAVVVAATAAVERLAPAAASAAADRLVREMAPALVEQVARLVVADFAERLVREEIARLRSAHVR